MLIELDTNNIPANIVVMICLMISSPKIGCSLLSPVSSPCKLFDRKELRSLPLPKELGLDGSGFVVKTDETCQITFSSFKRHINHDLTVLPPGVCLTLKVRKWNPPRYVFKTGKKSIEDTFQAWKPLWQSKLLSLLLLCKGHDSLFESRDQRQTICNLKYNGSRHTKAMINYMVHRIRTGNLLTNVPYKITRFNQKALNKFVGCLHFLQSEMVRGCWVKRIVK